MVNVAISFCYLLKISLDLKQGQQEVQSASNYMRVPRNLEFATPLADLYTDVDRAYVLYKAVVNLNLARWKNCEPKLLGILIYF